jgi:hypothetical protein
VYIRQCICYILVRSLSYFNAAPLLHAVRDVECSVRNALYLDEQSCKDRAIDVYICNMSYYHDRPVMDIRGEGKERREGRTSYNAFATF